MYCTYFLLFLEEVSVSFIFDTTDIYYYQHHQKQNKINKPAERGIHKPQINSSRLFFLYSLSRILTEEECSFALLLISPLLIEE